LNNFMCNIVVLHVIGGCDGVTGCDVLFQSISIVSTFRGGLCV